MQTRTKNGRQIDIRRISSILVLLFTTIVFVEDVLADANGRVGRSGAPPRNRDCTGCHTPGAGIPQVAFGGPTSVAPNSTSSYTFTVSGGAAANSAAGNAGLNIAASDGSLIATDPNTQLQTAEITHTAPTPLAGEVTYTFDWTAPANASVVTLYGAGLSGDGDNTEANDGTATTSFVITVGAGATPPGGGNPPGGGGPAPAPTPPAAGELTAVISGPTNATENVDVTFDGGNSTVAGATITDYNWDFGDGNAAAGVSVTNVFAAGNYVVTLAVTDDTGATNTAQLDITISAIGTNSAPGAVLYATNCEECHGVDGVGTAEAPAIVGASAEAISDAIATVAVMSALDTLTEDDIDEIAVFLEDPGATADAIGANSFSRSAHPPEHLKNSQGYSINSQQKETHTRVNSGSFGIDSLLLMMMSLTGLRMWRRIRSGSKLIIVNQKITI